MDTDSLDPGFFATTIHFVVKKTLSDWKNSLFRIVAVKRLQILFNFVCKKIGHLNNAIALWCFWICYNILTVDALIGFCNTHNFLIEILSPPLLISFFAVLPKCRSYPFLRRRLARANRQSWRSRIPFGRSLNFSRTKVLNVLYPVVDKDSIVLYNVLWSDVNYPKFPKSAFSKKESNKCPI